MTSKNLRIGNFIASSGNHENIETWVIGKVHSILSMDSEFEQIEIETEEEFTWFFKDNFFGIPLTEQWLIDFGFNKVVLSDNSAYYYTLRLKDEKYCDLSISSGDRNGFIEAATLFPYEDWFKYKYVHELQNLYHAITGQELELKIIK